VVRNCQSWRETGVNAGIAEKRQLKHMKKNGLKSNHLLKVSSNSTSVMELAALRKFTGLPFSKPWHFFETVRKNTVY